MSPALLAEYLRVMRDAGVMSARLQHPDGILDVTLEPKMPEGSPVTPGGWKGPDHLDAPEPPPSFVGEAP